MTISKIVFEIDEMYGERMDTQNGIADKLDISKKDVALATRALGYRRTVRKSGLKTVAIREKDFLFMEKYVR